MKFVFRNVYLGQDKEKKYILLFIKGIKDTCMHFEFFFRNNYCWF